ncbi:hypothetical protein CY34DRAFT_813485, partial [Suillus luteus UH-Slu-Lm8-n1]
MWLSGQHGASSASELQSLQASTTHKLTTDLDSFSAWKRGSIVSFVLQLTIGS